MAEIIHFRSHVTTRPMIITSINAEKIPFSSLIHQLLFGCDGVFPGLNYLRQLHFFREVFLHVRRDFYFFMIHVGTDHLLQTVKRKNIFI
uniref:Uncharacterized protein n=1 Tax=Pundamilia nyererei TaxID=303518 RepID=A0A3B4GL43_9CICH